MVEDRSYVSFLKREIHNLARPVFGERRTGEIDIVVSELCSNLMKHAGRGEILYRLGTEGEEALFEVICIDNGPGMSDVTHSTRDGVSSTNTLGHGIGSVNRLSSFAQFFSMEGWGTVVYSKFYRSADVVPEKSSLIVRGLCLAKPGERVSGDGYSVRINGDKILVMAGDGLGHGAGAHEAVSTALASFNTSVLADPSMILKEMNLAVKKTRGLVATVAVLDLYRKQWEICGVGNIHTRMQRGLESKNYICNNGIIGLNIPTRIENFETDMEKYQQLILCSDGIRTRWDLTKYPGILKYDPMILAAVIYKDHARKTDDMTVLVVKIT